MGYNKEKTFAVARLREAARDCKVRKTLLKLRHTASRTKVEDNLELDLKGFDRSAHDGVVLDKCNTFCQTQRPSSFVEQVGPAATPRGAEVPPGAPPT